MVVAIPSYNGRVFPRFEHAEEFHLAQVCLSRATVTTIDVVTFDGCGDIGAWLCRQNVKVVLCSGINQRQQILLQQAGIKLRWGFSGEVNAVLQQWLQVNNSGSSQAQDVAL